MHIRFTKIEEFIRVLDGEIKHLVSFNYGLFDKIWDRIKYLISEKSGITDSFDYNFKKSEFIHKMLYLLKKIDFFILL